jgi:hypothetical protein
MRFSLSLKLNVSIDRGKNRIMSHWLDDEDKRREGKSHRDDVLKAKAFRFWDAVFASIKRDVALMKERHALDLKVHQPQPTELQVQKQMPYPTLSVIVLLDVLSESVRVEWRRTDGRDQESYQSPPPIRWHLSLDADDELHVRDGEDEIEAAQASARILRPFLGR